MHSSHALEPSLAEYFPLVQFEHSVEPAAPEYVPAAHLLQLEAPSSEYLPAG